MHSHVSRTRLERLALRCSICTLREALIEAKRCKTMQNPSKFAKQPSEIPYELDGYLGFFHSEAQVLFKRLPCLLHYLHHPYVMHSGPMPKIHHVSSCHILAIPGSQTLFQHRNFRLADWHRPQTCQQACIQDKQTHRQIQARLTQKLARLTPKSVCRKKLK